MADNKGGDVESEGENANDWRENIGPAENY